MLRPAAPSVHPISSRAGKHWMNSWPTHSGISNTQLGIPSQMSRQLDSTTANSLQNTVFYHIHCNLSIWLLLRPLEVIHKSLWHNLSFASPSFQHIGTEKSNLWKPAQNLWKLYLSLQMAALAFMHPHHSHFSTWPVRNLTIPFPTQIRIFQALWQNTAPHRILVTSRIFYISFCLLAFPSGLTAAQYFSCTLFSPPIPNTYRESRLFFSFLLQTNQHS